MMSLILILTAVCTVLFYGVAGADKTWLLGPAVSLILAVVSVAMFRRAARLHGEDRGGAPVSGLPVSGLLWGLFVLYGIGLVPQASVPYESKLTMLLIGGIVGAYLVWGSELTAYKDNRILLGFLIFVVMVTALYGLIVHLKYPDRVLWAERYTDHYTSMHRLASTYICPNHFAHLMQMLMPFCIAMLFVPQAGLFLRLLCGYSLAVFLPPLFLTESRAGWLGAIAAVGTTICLMALRRSRKLFLLLMILVPLTATLVLFSAWRFSDTFHRRMVPVVSFLKGQVEEGVGSESRDFRPQTWKDTIDMIREAPLIGFGPGNYRYAFPEHRKRFKANQIVTGHPHNEYLELMADYGLVGFGLFALAWMYGLVRILSASLRAEEIRHAFMGFAFIGTAAGTMVHSFFDFEMHVFPNALVFALLAALAWGPLAAQQARHERRARRRIRREEGARSRREEQGDRESGQEASVTPSTDPRPPSLIPRRIGAWALAIAFLIGTGLSLQTMSSSFICAMADKVSQDVGIRQVALGTADPGLSPERWYRLAEKIDPQNWRAYQGVANLLFNRRYYALDMDEKIRLAYDECGMFAQAYDRNSKEPEICMSYGQVLIFLGKHQRDTMLPGESDITGQYAMGREQSSGGASDDTARGLQSANAKIAYGIKLLHEACRYRRFNDVYWWTLGVELRQLGRYEEALDAFKHARSLKPTPSTNKNIEWIEARITDQTAQGPDALAGQRGQRETAGGESDGGGETANPVRAGGAATGMPEPTNNAGAHPALMDLLERMN